MMNISKIFGAVAVFLSVVPVQAEESCRAQGGRFFPAQNDAVTVGVTTNAAGCDRIFRAGGQLMLTSASIVSGPKNGTLSKVGNLSFRYKPKAGYKGADLFVLKVCGSSRGSSGCSTITHEVRVE